MEKIELSNSSLRAIENYIAGKNILKDSVYKKLLTELNRCLKSLDNYVTFQTAEGTMQQYCDRLLKKYEGLKDAMLKTRDYYDNLTDWKREFHNVGMNKDNQEELPMQMKLVRTIAKTKKKDADVEWKSPEAEEMRFWFYKKGLQLRGKYKYIEIYLRTDLMHWDKLDCGINWSAIGTVSPKEAKDFAAELVKASKDLEDAMKEAKKKFPFLKD